MDNLENMTDEQIDQAYDNLLKIADSVKQDAEDENYLNTMPVENNEDSIIPESTTTSASTSGDDVVAVYNQETGELIADPAMPKQKYIDQATVQWNSFVNNSDEMDFDILKTLLSEEDMKNITDIEKLAELMKKSDSNRVLYSELPDYLKSVVDKILVESGRQLNSGDKNFVSNMILKELQHQYMESANAVIDLDQMLSGFDEEVEKMTSSMAKEVGDMMMTIDQQRKAEIDAAIARCEESGKTEAKEKLLKMKETLDSSYNLEGLIEFCKHVRIKHFELEKPKKVFDSFNFKYTKHKNNINDINACPAILNRHTDFGIENCYKICIAFCKYAANMKPDNIDEHTFMYYFIRNIIALDRINPKGNLYESMDDVSKKFYDGFVENLTKCVEALKRD